MTQTHDNDTHHGQLMLPQSGKVAIYAGVAPGKKGLAEREGLKQLLDTICSRPEGEEPIGAIFVSTVDRLFQDADMASVGQFMNICAEKRETNG